MKQAIFETTWKNGAPALPPNFSPSGGLQLADDLLEPATFLGGYELIGPPPREFGATVRVMVTSSEDAIEAMKLMDEYTWLEDVETLVRLDIEGSPNGVVV